MRKVFNFKPLEKFYLKALLHFLLFVSIFLFVLPSLSIDLFRRWFLSFEGVFFFESFFTWAKFFFKPLLEAAPFAFIFCLSLVLGLSAVQEFAIRAQGTLLDPPKKFICTGPYAFVRHPMQLSLLLIALDHLIIFWWKQLALIVLFLLIVGLVALVLACIILIGIVFYHIFTEWREKALSLRFGEEELFKNYRNKVYGLLPPRWRAFRVNTAELYIDFNHCGACARLKRLVLWLSPQKLNIQPAEHYRWGPIKRLTYRDGDFEAVGIHAICRTLEHTNFALAFIGFVLRLPPLSWLLQILSDRVFPPHLVKTALKQS